MSMFRAEELSSEGDTVLSPFTERDLLETLLFDQVSSPVSSEGCDNSALSDELNFLFPTGDVIEPLISATSTYVLQKHPRDNDNDDDEPRKIRKGDGKDQDRVELQREASRRYRKKQKELIEKLENQVKAIQEEKEETEKKNQELRDALNKVSIENRSLKKNHLESAQQIDAKRNAIMVELEIQVQENAPDEKLLETMNRLDECCRQVIEIGECHWGMLISPNFVHHLVQNGFFEEKAKRTQDFISDSKGINYYLKRLKATVKDLTPEQIILLDQIVDEYTSSLQAIQTERATIDSQIRELFGDTMQKGKRDMRKIIEMVSELELLRKNLKEESDLWELTTSKFGQIVTIRQRARFYLDVEYQHKSVDQLKIMWDSVRKLSKP
eukprot:TRINITY_DN4465_c0_g1_i1.p1 TRINITY_DN4465_c0_g1~~TRINITY_DN4465_c0_g1_i1.p1  ORF type:complete len:383 (+),score=70.02 TRINITY_DN4465_c0_g1_i1:95-1243(+)